MNYDTKRTVEIRVGGRYRLGKKIGAGSFGEIYEGYDILGGSEVAIKLEYMQTKYPQLLFEAKLMKSITGKGIPVMNWYGLAGEYNTLVMDLLGQNLEELFIFCGRNFTLKTIIMISIEIINRIKFFHDHHYLHRDIKPENFLIGKGSNENVIYLIDFGLSKRYRDEQTRIHISFKEGKSLTGTARYASRNSHNGIEQSRRDDMESIGYMLIYLLKGSLPWQGLKCADKNEKYNKIKEIKNNIDPYKLCEGLPIEFAKFLEHCYSLKFEDEPNYKYLLDLFQKLFSSKDYESDNNYDWVTAKYNNKILKDASICHSDEFAKCQNQIEKQKKGNELVNSTVQQNNDTIQEKDNNHKILSTIKKYDAEAMTTTYNNNNARTDINFKSKQNISNNQKKDKCIVF